MPRTLLVWLLLLSHLRFWQRLAPPASALLLLLLLLLLLAPSPRFCRGGWLYLPIHGRGIALPGWVLRWR